MSTRRNFKPSAWGPHAWEFLDTAVLSYPSDPTKEDAAAMATFLTSLAYALPCESCRQHYSEYLQLAPLTPEVLSSWQTLVRWLLGAHNRVRAMSAKPPIALQEFMNYYLGDGRPTIALERDRAAARPSQHDSESDGSDDDDDKAVKKGAKSREPLPRAQLAVVIAIALVAWLVYRQRRRD